MLNKKIRGIEYRKSISGLIFISPWILGIILFFLVPIIQSLWYSLCDVTIIQGGVDTDFTRFGNYKYLLAEDPEYMKLLSESLTQFMYYLPLILIISMVLALILNQRFKGRLLFRALFFLPVIIANGIVLDLLLKTTGEAFTMSGVSDSLSSNMFEVEDIMAMFDLSPKIANYVQGAISNIFDLIWNCGVQIVLFIAGLQAIPKSIYEACYVEGATKWEEFWFITFPMMSRVTLLVCIFTMIELFTDKSSPIINKAYALMSSGDFDQTSAMLWFYFIVVGIIMGIVIGVYNQLFLKKWR